MIGERTKAGSSSILMALFAASLARITGINPVVIRPVVHNRFRPGLEGVVCQVAQSGICAVDVAGATFDEVAGRAKRATTVAYKNAYYDPEQHAALSPGSAWSGPGLRRRLLLQRPPRRRDRDPATTAAMYGREPPRGQSASTFTWTEKKDNPYERMFIHIDEDPTGIQVTVCADTHYFSPAHIEELARSMESVAVEAALDPAMTALASPQPQAASHP